MNDEIIDKRYKVRRSLGQGGMGKVLECHDTVLDKKVAVKMLHGYACDDLAERFHREAKNTAKLDHPNIVRVLDFGITEDDELYLVMDYLKGKSLSAILSKGALPVEEALLLGEQITLALHEAHKHGILHRDIKPSNVMIVKGDRKENLAKLVDFGFSKFIEGDGKLTMTGVGLGSPPYISPEMGSGKEADERSDIYSFGCLLFELLAGEPPFVADNSMVAIMMHATTIPDTLEKRTGEQFPKQLEDLVARCLMKKPEDRFQNCKELLDEIRSVREISSIPIVEEEPSVPPYKHPKNIALVAGLVLCLCLFVIPSIIAAMKDKQPEDEQVSDNLVKKDVTEVTSLFLTKEEDEKFGKPRLKLNTKSIPPHYKAQGAWSDDAVCSQLPGRTDIRFLKLGHGDFSKKGFEVLASMDITMLELSKSSITDDALWPLTKSTRLGWLQFRHMPQFKNEQIKILKSIKNLHYLNLVNVGITDACIDDLAGMTGLGFLGIGDCANFKGERLDRLSALPRLTHFALTSFSGRKKQLKNIGAIDSLSVLDLSRSGIDDTDMKWLSGMKVRTLNISSCPVSARGIEQLASMKSLERLILSNCSNLAKADIDAFRIRHKGIDTTFNR